jgi:hypothetical protein
MDRGWRGAALAVVGVGAVSIAGCGPSPGTAEAPSPVAAETVVDDRNLVAEDYAGRYRARATVLESELHGPQLCHAVAETMAPQCGGPDVLGWDWSAVPAESFSGTTWGDYELVGTFADGAFTLTEPAVPYDPRASQGPSPAEEGRLASPCPEPAGGWAPTDPLRTTQEALNEAQELASGSPGVGGVWIDRQGRRPEPMVEEDLTYLLTSVLNVSTTGDVAELDAALRGVWGGALCVSVAPRSEAELMAVVEALPDIPGRLNWGPDSLAGIVDVQVVRGTQEQQQALDAQFGAGLVHLSGALEPID